MNRFWKRILPLAALWLVSFSLPAGVDAKVPARAHPVRHRPVQGPSNNARQGPSDHARQGPSDHDMLLQLRDGQQALQREIGDLRQSFNGLRQSFKDNLTMAGESARDANDRLEKQTAQRFQMLDGRINFIRTLLVLTFIALLAALGGTLLIWQRLTMLEKSLGQRLVTVEQRVSDLGEQSNKWVAGP
jgi:hypothetical protein